MGLCYSTLSDEQLEEYMIRTDAEFSRFIEHCCVKTEDGFTPLNLLQCAWKCWIPSGRQMDALTHVQRLGYHIVWDNNLIYSSDIYPKINCVVGLTLVKWPPLIQHVDA